MRLRLLFISVLALTVSGCGSVLGPTDAEMTLQAQNQDLSTQIADLRQTATVEVDRMMITVEHAATEVRSVAFQRDALRATLIARGTDPGFLDVTGPVGATLPDGISAENLLPQATAIGAVPAVTPVGAAPVAIDPAAIAAAPVEAVSTATPPPAQGPRLTNATLATGVGSNDCALNSLTTFETTTPEIYIVATAQDFPAGTVMTARWALEGQVMGSYDIPFSFEIQNACVWAYIDQSDFPFTPGNWTVELLVNQLPSVGPLPFTITGNMETTTDG